MFLLSPNKAHVGDEFEVQSHMFGLALTGLKCRVHGASESSFCHHQTITLNIQVTLEGEWWKKNTCAQVFTATSVSYSTTILLLVIDTVR